MAVPSSIGADALTVGNRLAPGYYKKVQKQREVFNKLDTALSILELLPSLSTDDYLDVYLGNYGISLSKDGINFSLSPLNFLFSILKTLGVSEKALREWIVEILVYTLPAVETGVKATLLSNIKSLVSCNTDPRIPLEFRKRTTNSIFSDNSERGFNIPIDAIDPNGILDLSPFTKPGILKYFGCVSDSVYDETIKKEIEKSYDSDDDLFSAIKRGDSTKRLAKLCRADDFNAFLWYVIHKANRKVPHLVKRERRNGKNGFLIKGLGNVDVWKNIDGDVYTGTIDINFVNRQKDVYKKFEDAYNSRREIIEASNLILINGADGTNVTDAKKKELITELNRAYRENNETHFNNIIAGTNLDKILTEFDFSGRSNGLTYYTKEKTYPFYISYDFPELSKNYYTLLGAVGIKLVLPNNCSSDGVSESTIIPGDTFYEEGSKNTISICIKNIYEKGKVIGHILVPLSSDWFSCNWYVDKTNYYSNNIGIKSNDKPRDYSNEKAICNLRYVKNGSVESSYYNIDTPDYFNLTILPKPYMMLPSVNLESKEEDEVTLSLRWQPIRLLFDANGEATQSGNYSFRSEHSAINPPLKFSGTTENDESYYYIEEEIYRDDCDILVVNNKTGKYYLKNIIDNAPKHTNNYLVECYNGLTVYEFNYDFIMGMKLFDPKVICQQLFENSVNPRYNANFSLSLNNTKDKNKYPYFSDKQRLLDMIRNILYEDDEEINDCFYSFSNEQYETLLEETEKLKYNCQPFNQGYNDGSSLDFSKVNDILSDYPETGTLEEQKTIISKALEQACATFDEQKEVLALEDSSTVKIDFLTDMLGKITMSIVESILSPKVLMILMVNEELMINNSSKKVNAEDLLKAMKGVIKGVVSEIRDLILQKILDFIISSLAPMALKMAVAQEQERSERYLALMRLLYGWFNIGIMTTTRLSSVISSLINKFKKKNKKHFENLDIDLPTVLDNVDYADIYDSIVSDNVPKISDC